MATEKQIEERLVERVKAAGGFCPKWTSPNLAGVPDRIVILPGGRVVFVELKAPGCRPTPLQQRIHRMLEERGCDVRVLASVEAVDEMLLGFR